MTSNKLLLLNFVFLSIVLAAGSLSAQDYRENLIIEADSLILFAEQMPEDSAVFKLESAKRALSIYEAISDLNGIAKSNALIGQAYFEQMIYAEAIKYYKISINYYSQLKDSSNLAGVYSLLGDVYSRSGKFDLAINSHVKASQIYSKIDKPLKAVAALNSIALINLSLGNYNEAQKLFLKALETREKVGEQSAIASSYNNLGVLYWRWGKLSEALENYEKAISIRESINDEVGQIFPMLNIGLILMELLDFEYAEKHLTKGLEKAKELNYKRGITIAYLYLADLHYQKHNHGLSLEYASQAQQLMEEMNENMGWVRTQVFKAKNLVELNKFEEAEKCMIASLKILKDFKNTQIITEVYYTYALVEYEKGNYLSADSLMMISMDNCNCDAILTTAKNNYRLLSKIKNMLGEQQIAYYYFEKYSDTKDSIFNRQIVNAVSNWRVKYETAKQKSKILYLQNQETKNQAEIERQVLLRDLFFVIAILAIGLLSIILFYIVQKRKMRRKIGDQNFRLQELNKLLQKRNEELEKINITKDKLFSIIAHDLKNPFVGLLGLSEELSDSIDELSRDEIKAGAEIIKTSSKKLLQLSSNLLDWARINTEQFVAKFEKIDLQNFMNKFISTIKSQADSKQIILEVDINGTPSCECDENMLEIILRNFINNAIKFSNPGGKIIVALQNGNDGVTFRIKDNGIGIDSESLKAILTLNKFHSTQGTNYEKGSGLGVSICRELIELNNGNFTIKSEPGMGTEISFVIPNNQKNR